MGRRIIKDSITVVSSESTIVLWHPNEDKGITDIDKLLFPQRIESYDHGDRLNYGNK